MAEPAVARSGQRWPACDSDIRAFVSRLLCCIEAELGSELLAIYLHGSLAMGCYYRPKSDIDLLVLSNGALPPTTRRALARRLLALSDTRPTLGDLELSVLQRCYVQAPTFPLPYELHFGENLRAAIRADTIDYTNQDQRDPDLAAHLTVTRRRGIALHGPPAATLLAAVPWEAYLAAVIDDWAWLAEGAHIEESPYYGVLNGCRVAQMVSLPGTVASKEEGALWALAHLPAEHHPVIQQALACYRDTTPLPPGARLRGGQEWERAALHAFAAFVSSQVAAAAGATASGRDRL